MLKGNKGEWGEIYAFCHLLSSGILQSADSNLNPIEGVYFPIIKILRHELGNDNMTYEPANDEHDEILVYAGENLVCTLTVEELNDIVRLLYEKIPEGIRSFDIPETDEFFEQLNISKLKADSLHKQDIDIQIHDINTGISPVCGFSIKSFLGANPTLINATKGTNFIYSIPGCTDEIMQNFNAISTNNKLIDRMKLLSDNQLTPHFDGLMISGQFRTNLKYIDTLMPEIIGEALLNFFSSGVATKRVREVISEIAIDDKFGFGSEEMYAYKVKMFLCACALGMTPEKNWVGQEDANGGYITVKRDGSVVCYHIYNRQDFYQYLYNYTYFEKGSSSRHEYMKIYKSNGEYYLNLNLQVRFIEV